MGAAGQGVPMSTTGSTTNGPTESRSPGTIDELGGDLAVAALAVARRFSAGATMWCVGPVWTEHARHVAVEFVHPVIVGKRALPALTIDSPDPVAALRPMAASGDVLVLVGDASTPGARDLLRRADAWGLTTVWCGAGDRAPAGSAHHVLWTDGDPAARHDGSVVRLYHLLWELTHVCFEHAAVLTPADVGAGEVCVTCSDEGRPGEVLSVDDHGMAAVRTSGGVETVDTTIVAPVGTGDLVLIHAGTAIAVLDEL